MHYQLCTADTTLIRPHTNALVRRYMCTWELAGTLDSAISNLHSTNHTGEHVIVKLYRFQSG